VSIPQDVIGNIVCIVGSIIILFGFGFLEMPRRRTKHTLKAHKYPRIIGYDGVWCEGYHDKSGKWIEPGFEFANVEIAPRTYTQMETTEAREKGIPEAWSEP